MAHAHNNGSQHINKIFLIAISLNIAFAIIESLYGYWSGSLSLIADAGHNISDVFGLLLGLGATILSQRIPSPRRTYGLRRSSILAAVANSIILLVAVGGISWEAILRLNTPSPVVGTTVIWIAGIGIIVNTISALLFLSGHKDDLNSKGAFLHLTTDALVSVGVVLAGVIITITGLNWVDPIISLVVVAVILVSTWGILKSSINLALDAVPEGIDPLEVEKYLKAVPGVKAVHDMHIWGMSTTEAALTAHLIIPHPTSELNNVHTISHELHKRFGIEHCTIQIEQNDSEEDCKQASPIVV